MRIVFLAACLWAVTCAAQQPAFEVASVKPATRPPGPGAPMGMRGGPGSADPERIAYTNLTLKLILLSAFGVREYRLSGPPWLDTERFDITATIPPGTTKEQFSLMLQNLMVERFNLMFHHETKDLQVYELVVGKNGPKLKESETVVAAPPAPGTPMRMAPDKNGFPSLLPGRPGLAATFKDGLVRMTGRMVSLSSLASWLESFLGRPAFDKTGLPGKYDFNLEFSNDGLANAVGRLPPPVAAPGVIDTPSDSGVTLTAAVQQQLGLKLEPKKSPIDIVVIDRVDKVPTEN